MTGYTLLLITMLWNGGQWVPVMSATRYDTLAQCEAVVVYVSRNWEKVSATCVPEVK